MRVPIALTACCAVLRCAVLQRLFLHSPRQRPGCLHTYHVEAAAATSGCAPLSMSTERSRGREALAKLERRRCAATSACPAARLPVGMYAMATSSATSAVRCSTAEQTLGMDECSVTGAAHSIAQQLGNSA